MRKASDFLSKPLISLNEGKNEGVIKNISFDAGLKSAEWLVLYDENDCDCDEKAVRVSEAYSVGENAVMIKSGQAVVPAVSAPLNDNNPINCRIFTALGKLIGVVSDVILTEGNLTAELIYDNDKVLPLSEIVSSSKDIVVRSERGITAAEPVPAKRVPPPGPADTKRKVKALSKEKTKHAHAPEEPKSKEHAPEEPKSKEPAPEEPKSKEPAPEEPKSKGPAPEESKSKEPAPEESKSKEPAPEKPKSKEPAPEEPKGKEPADAKKTVRQPDGSKKNEAVRSKKPAAQKQGIKNSLKKNESVKITAESATVAAEPVKITAGTAVAAAGKDKEGVPLITAIKEEPESKTLRADDIIIKAPSAAAPQDTPAAADPYKIYDDLSVSFSDLYQPEIYVYGAGPAVKTENRETDGAGQELGIAVPIKKKAGKSDSRKEQLVRAFRAEYASLTPSEPAAPLIFDSGNGIEIWPLELEHIPERIITSYSFLLGRRVAKNIYNAARQLVIKADTVVNPQIVETARKYGRLVDLTKLSL